MISSFRNSLKGGLAYVIVAILCVPFALFGVEQLFFGGASTQSAAEVDGERISDLDLQRAIQREKQTLSERFEGLDLGTLDDELLRPQVLEQLIRSKLMELAAKDNGMAISQAKINSEIVKIEEFQSDGRFDPDRYRFVLSQIGHTPATFTETVRADFLTQQFRSGILETAFATPAEVAQLAAFTEQKRSYYYLLLPLESAKSAVDVTDDALQQYYQDHLNDYQEPEKVSVDYIELTRDQVASNIEISADEIEDHLQDVMANLSTGTNRLAAHILLDPEDDLDSKVRTIEQRLAAGEDFAELASEFSLDFGSAENGGQLGFTDGSVFPEPFETALSGLAVGEVSAPVTTDSGVHLIKLVEEENIEFDAAAERVRIERQLRDQRAAELLNEKVADLKDAVFSAETLADPAQELGLKVETSGAFGRTGGEGVAQYPAVVKAAFSDEVLVDKYASPVVEVSDGHHIVVKLREYTPARTLDFAEVKDRVAQRYVDQQATASQQQRAETLLARIQGGQSVESVAAAEGLQWQAVVDAGRRSVEHDSAILQKVFLLPLPSDSAVNAIVDKPGGDLALVSLTAVTDGNADSLPDMQKRALGLAASQAAATQEMAAYIDQMRVDADVEVMPPPAK